MTWYCAGHRLAQCWADARVTAESADGSPPDLQKLVAGHDGYHRIPPEAWAEYDAAMARWQVQRREKFKR
jgi:hypothetical protein